MANGLKADFGPLRVLWDVGTLAGLDDRALLARFVDDGSGFAFEGLVRRHGPMVLRVCSQLLDDPHAAEDAFQAVFLVLARRAGSIRRPEQLAPWLHGVALRTAKESRSRENRRRQIERRGPTMSPTASGPPEHSLIRAEEAEVLHVEISRLPERYRSTVVLCDLEGLTHQEAASRLRCPVGTVAIRVKRARERLRARLSRRGLDPTAGWMVATFGPSGTFPIPSSSLIEATVRASTTAGLASASVVSLAQGVHWTITIAKWKATALALGLAATWGVASELQAPAKAERQDGPARKIEKAALKEIRDYEDYLGRTEPSQLREIRAHVAGTLEKALVADGARVKAKDVLFEIDPKPYKAALELASARVKPAEAREQLARTVTARNARLLEKNPQFVSKEDQEKANAELLQCHQATFDAKQAETQAKVDLAATQVKAPFDGQVIRRTARPGEPDLAGHTALMTLAREVNPGASIKARETVLAKLVATDPMAVTFDVDERTILKLRRMFGDDKAKAAEDLTIRVALRDEKEFSRPAKLEFLPDKLDPATGTGQFRATIPNPDGSLLAGMLARVRITIGKPREALLVPNSAVMTGGQGATVYVVDDRNIVEERVVKVGQLHGDLRVIREGLKPGDRLVTGDLSTVRPGMPLKP